MTNLYDYLSSLDKKRIYNFVTTKGVNADSYVGNDDYLLYWNIEKRKMFHLLGGELIRKFPFEYVKSQHQIEEELRLLVNKSDLSKEFRNSFYPIIEKADIPDTVSYSILQLFTNSGLINETINTNIKYKWNNANSTLQLQRGTKTIRAIQKVIKYFELNKVMPVFEDFRIKHSMIYNEKNIKGNICLSIHPLDFMTSSDNNSNWTSCLSWADEGCYRTGTVEMMNSNNVICCYIESKTPYQFKKGGGDAYTWNNKKWRQYFYVTKEIIVGGKSYPYLNEDISKKVLSIVKDLAHENLNWDYEYGPELYQDMKHINTYAAMENNRNWLFCGDDTKRNIIFDTKNMYNDMLNNEEYPFWCFRNKVKKRKIISYSGKAPCLCCMKTTLDDENIDFDYDGDRYNNRFKNTGTLLCTSCTKDRTCKICNTAYYFEKSIKVKGQNVCKECAKDFIKICPDCGEPFIVPHILYPQEGDNLCIIKTKDEPIYIQDITKSIYNHTNFHHFSLFYTCEDCFEKRYKSLFELQTFYPADGMRETWRKSCTMNTSKVIYDTQINSYFISKHNYMNLIDFL